MAYSLHQGSAMGTNAAADYERGNEYEYKDEYALRIRALEGRITHYRKWLEAMHQVQDQIQPGLIQMTKQIYIGNLPPKCNFQELRQYISDAMRQANANIIPGNSVSYCKILPEQTYAWVTFRSVEEASNALLLDGLMFYNHRLTLRRPNTYDARKAILMGPTMPDPNVDTSNLDIRAKPDSSSNKFNPAKTVQVRGLPTEWNYYHVKTFFSELGDLEQFRLVTDRITRMSLGTAYCQFGSESMAIQAVSRLNGMRIGGHHMLHAQLQAMGSMEGGMSSGAQSGGRSHHGGRRGKRRGGGARRPPVGGYPRQ